MILEGLSVCCGYSDFLAHTIALNRTYFNKYVVVTSYDDKDTQRLCEYYHVAYIKTDVFFTDGANFNKGSAINEGLKYLSKKGWVLHLDADIYLPPLFRTIFETLELNPNCIYGFDRFNCKGLSKWIEFISKPKLIYKEWIYQDNNIFEKVDRFMPYFDEGYIPIGYAQLWSPIESCVFEYIDKHGYADRTDVLFAKRWPKKHRRFIPELIGIHLESDDASNGMNWNGRKSSSFYIEDMRDDKI